LLYLRIDGTCGVEAISGFAAVGASLIALAATAV